MAVQQIGLLVCFGFLAALAGADELYQGDVVSDGQAADNQVEDDPHCRHHMHKFYRKMRCEPELGPDSNCPTSYKCATLLHRSPNHCYHEGLMYPVGSNITRHNVDFHSPCIESCQCVRLYEGVRFVCSQTTVNKTCNLAVPGCRRFSFLEDFPCCDDGVTSCNQGKEDSVKCVHGGRSYGEGEVIMMTDDPTCTQCICASDFNGTASAQFCREMVCALEFWGDAPVMLTRGCIPLYVSNEGCCPVAFRCPDPSDRIIKPKNFSGSPSIQSDKKCYFGNLTMEIGDRLTPRAMRNAKDIECSCRIPPLPSCIRKNFVLPDTVRRDIAKEALEERHGVEQNV